MSNSAHAGRHARDMAVFESAPIPAAVMTLAIPTIITQLINIIYNFADTWYVGRKDSRYARKTFSFCFYGGMISAVLFALLILFFRSRLIPVIGGDKASFQYIYDYMFWTMIAGAVPTVGNVLCGHLVRSVGAAKEAGFGMSLGGILNIILDPLFMFVILPPGNEVTGAAIATCLSNTAAMGYFLVYLYQHRDHEVLSLSPSEFTVGEDIPGNVVSIGIPAALATTMAMLSNIAGSICWPSIRPWDLPRAFCLFWATITEPEISIA